MKFGACVYRTARVGYCVECSACLLFCLLRTRCAVNVLFFLHAVTLKVDFYFLKKSPTVNAVSAVGTEQIRR